MGLIIGFMWGIYDCVSLVFRLVFAPLFLQWVTTGWTMVGGSGSLSGGVSIGFI